MCVREQTRCFSFMAVVLQYIGTSKISNTLITSLVGFEEQALSFIAFCGNKQAEDLEAKLSLNWNFTVYKSTYAAFQHFGTVCFVGEISVGLQAQIKNP